MTELKIGGVPEHFNLPWHLAIEDHKFEDQGIDLQWTDFHGGTGAMCSALREGSIDIAIILTEGIIKDIINGNPSKIVKIFVKSPLLWGIHVDANSKFNHVEELQGAKVAISRYGSGSQLMAIVNAHKHDFPIDTLQYEVVKNLHGAIDALTDGSADYFLWEHFTTKPIVDTGIFKRIGNIETPWPCFVMTVRDEVLESNKQAIKTIITVINKQLSYFKNSLYTPELITLFSERYNQKPEDVKQWLGITKWSTKKTISMKNMEYIQNKLLKYNVIENVVHVNQLIKNVF